MYTKYTNARATSWRLWQHAKLIYCLLLTGYLIGVFILNLYLYFTACHEGRVRYISIPGFVVFTFVPLLIAFVTIGRQINSLCFIIQKITHFQKCGLASYLNKEKEVLEALTKKNPGVHITTTSLKDDFPREARELRQYRVYQRTLSSNAAWAWLRKRGPFLSDGGQQSDRFNAAIFFCILLLVIIYGLRSVWGVFGSSGLDLSNFYLWHGIKGGPDYWSLINFISLYILFLNCMVVVLVTVAGLFRYIRIL